MNCPICNHGNRDEARFCANCRTPLILQNKYRITGLLGRGGYGAVYQAEHMGLGGAIYAIKELLPEPNATPVQQQAASDQFRLEASLLAKLNHPTLPKVMDFFTEGYRDYLVMEFVEGETLEERLRQNRGPLPEVQVLAWASELCDALTYLHTRRPSPIIHRDVKPVNIKLTPEGKLKLLDFGIAKIMVVGAGTVGAARAVSPPYSPMEQYGAGTDARSDVYSLGVTLYQLLSNQMPPDAPDRSVREVIPLRHLNLALRPMTEAAIHKAMAEKAVDRFQCAVDLKQALCGEIASAIKPMAASPALTATFPIKPLSESRPARVTLPGLQLSVPQRALLATAAVLIAVVVLILIVVQRGPNAPFVAGPSINAVTLLSANPYVLSNLAPVPSERAISIQMKEDRAVQVLDLFFELANANPGEVSAFISPACQKPVFAGSTHVETSPTARPVWVHIPKEIVVSGNFCVLMQASAGANISIGLNQFGQPMLRVAVSKE